MWSVSLQIQQGPVSSLLLLQASTMWRSCFLLAVLAGCVDPVTGYSNGKVSVACGDMVPQHGYEPSPHPPPYSITVDKSTFSPGDNITGRLPDSAMVTHHLSWWLTSLFPLIVHPQCLYKWLPPTPHSSGDS